MMLVDQAADIPAPILGSRWAWGAETVTVSRSETVWSVPAAPSMEMVRRSSQFEEVPMDQSALPGTGSAPLRPEIERSWIRSSACGVGSDLDQALIRYNPDFDDDSRLIRAARPVLDRLVVSLADTHHSVFLADPEARVLQRWVGMKALNHSLDRAHIAPGFEFSEEFTGTNGVGTALEESRVIVVRGEEHYADFLKKFACVGVPIQHPTSGRVEGILDFTCLATDYDPLMAPFVVEAAKHIETRLAYLSSAAEQALMEGFVHGSRTHRGPVVALRPDFFLANTAALQLLGSTDQAVLWDAARSLLAGGRDEGTVSLLGGEYRVRITVVDVGSHAEQGVVARLAPVRVQTARQLSAKQPAPGERPTGLVGRSPQWQHVLTQIEKAADSTRPIVISGELGTGKSTVARQIHHLTPTTGDLSEFVCTGQAETDDALMTELREALVRGDDVLLRRIDRLTDALRSQLTDQLRNDVPAGRILATCDDSPSGATERTLAAFAHNVWLPPLRQRQEDIADLVPALLAELTPDRRTGCGLPAVQALMRYPWPGNTSELRDVLKAAVDDAGRGGIDVQHLPAWVLKRANRRQLTPMEQGERDLIIDALASVQNNRTDAAKILGIGRATLYRKLRTLEISSGEVLAH
ncbi:transcriptional regulator of acetoin/glycerol metabolism [Rhodococcus opacus]|nr:transcriptional regulator of acetoin/glycerol metabolism [Rhodococcus opacus]